MSDSSLEQPQRSGATPPFPSGTTGWVQQGDAQRLSQILALMPAGVYACDAVGRITYFNERAAALWGRKPALHDDQEKFCACCKVFLPDGTLVPPDETPMAIAVREGRSFRDVEATVERPDGSRFVASVSIDVIRDAQGKLVGAINVFQDVTERKRAEEANALLAAIVESSGDAIISKTLEGRITSWNPEARRIFGYTAEEMIGQSILTLIPSERHAEETEILRRLRRGERIEHFETVRLTKDGRRLDISLSVSPVRDSVGRITGASKIARDITQRKRAEKAMHETEQRFGRFMQHLPGLAWIKDLDGRYIFINDSASRVFGRTREQIYGKTDDELFSSHIAAQFQQNDQEALAHGTGIETIEEFEQGDGVHHSLVAKFPIFDAEGQAMFVGGMAIDITQRLAAEAALRHAKDAAESANRAKDRFLAVLSHELRTPLMPVLMWVAMMQRDTGLSAELKQDLAMLRENVELETRLIDDLLDLSRITSGKLQLSLQPVRLNDLVKHACEMCRPQIDQKHIQVHLALEPGLASIQADGARLQQVLWNVIKNAAKFTPEGGHIHVSTAHHGDDAVRVQVRDSGIGIAPEVLPRVFDAFEQGEAKTTRQFGGLGLGLAISKALVELHDGTIRADSPGPGQGAVFTVDLPADRDEAGARTLALPLGNPNLSKPLRVLVVEDHPDTARMLVRLLQSWSYVVHQATSAAEALEAIARHRVDLVLSDIGLPDATGYQLLKSIRQHHRVPAIAMSGYGMEHDIRQSREAGFFDHLVKPINADQLEQSIRRVAASLVS